MRQYNKTKSFISLTLTLGFSLNILGSMQVYLNDMPPYYSRAVVLEDWISTKVFKKLHQTYVMNEQKIKERILKIASKYKTGLNAEDLSAVSDQILMESQKYGYDPLLLTALIITESSFNNWARSRKGALGLMQIVPKTGYAIANETNLKWHGKKTLFDPESNIVLGTYYLNKLVKRFGDLGLALEAYNHGPSQLKKYLNKGMQPKQYSRKVLRNYRKVRAQVI